MQRIRPPICDFIRGRNRKKKSVPGLRICDSHGGRSCNNNFVMSPALRLFVFFGGTEPRVRTRGYILAS